MIPEERFKKILSLMEINGSITVDELKSRLYVSEATARRDLAELSKRGLIVRFSGGALPVTVNSPAVKASRQHPAPAPISEKAIELIKKGGLIFIGASALTLSMSQLLASSHAFSALTVVTNSMKIADTLCNDIAHVHCTGGRYLPGQSIFVGRQAADYVEHFRYDQCFISCDGLSFDGFVTHWGDERLTVEQAAVNRSHECILLCGRDEVGVTASNSILPLHKVHTIVTDAPEKIPKNYPGTIIGISDNIRADADI
ncbi:MAG: DeoR/GlpR family DNA-binding transcription regulator [Clostridiales bacterium]|nr:DeoR/GlpR family DNA-binding transcription regulator [Clostridiales bacterium]